MSTATTNQAPPTVVGGPAWLGLLGGVVAAVRCWVLVDRGEGVRVGEAWVGGGGGVGGDRFRGGGGAVCLEVFGGGGPDGGGCAGGVGGVGLAFVVLDVECVRLHHRGEVAAQLL